MDKIILNINNLTLINKLQFIEEVISGKHSEIESLLNTFMGNEIITKQEAAIIAGCVAECYSHLDSMTTDEFDFMVNDITGKSRKEVADKVLLLGKNEEKLEIINNWLLEPVIYSVRNFRYNGSIFETLGMSKYTAVFKEWSNKPGIGIYKCSDNKERKIPTSCLIGNTKALPEQSKTIIFNEPSNTL